MGWQPIETAPSEVRRCLLWCSDYDTFRRRLDDDGPIKFGRIIQGKAYGEGMTGDWSFSHWMPLPKPPLPASADGAEG